ncbi:MAG: hypothetical protein QNJ42_13325 [Crocosphaera sp.]|nr:hypothetical protein [Crocosphaera sp.]
MTKTLTENIINQSELESIKKLSLDEKQKIISFLEKETKEADDKTINFLNSNFNLVTPIIDSMTEIIKHYLETSTSDNSLIINKYSGLEKINEAIKDLLKSDIDEMNKVKIVELMIEANEKYNKELNEIIKSKEQSKRNIIIVGIMTLFAIIKSLWDQE